MTQTIVRRSEADYAAALQALLPVGAAWTFEKGALLTQLIDAIAVEFARVDTRGADLREEADPRTALELLADWERVTGLPDPCAGQADTIAERRARVVRALTARGGQSPAYFVALAAALGFAIEIEELRPFRVGLSSVGGRLAAPPWNHVWIVRAPETTIRNFVVGAAVGEPLRSWGNAILACVMQRFKPAHTRLIITYGAEA